MKPSAIYRKAARHVEEKLTASCTAISYIVTGSHRKECAEAEAYARLFSPSERSRSSTLWGTQWGREVNEADAYWLAIRECRVLALLFMSAIEESEGR